MVASFVQNFTTAKQYNNTSIGSTATAAALINSNPCWPDCMAINIGTVNVQLAFGTSGVVALNTAAASGSNQTLIPPGETMIIGMNGAQYFSAITDSGTGSLILHVGAGS